MFDLKKEELVTELKSFVTSGPLGLALYHKLIHEPIYHEEMNSYYNQMFAQKKISIEKALKEENWSLYVWLHERPYRLEAFIECVPRIFELSMTVEEKREKYKIYWELLGDIWTDSENIWQFQKYWKHLLGNNEDLDRFRPNKEYFMSEADRQVFKNLPEELTIYRGYHPGKNRNGFSYSLDKKKAEWFATRFNKRGGKVLTLKVKKSDVFAYTNARNEKEIIYIK